MTVMYDHVMFLVVSSFVVDRLCTNSSVTKRS